MSVFAPHNIETMNEDDVAGELIRPLCRALGYTQGNPEANLRSQVSLQYDKAFLGHKKGEKDPILRGKPDFVCEVVSYARWVVEAKKPSIQLSQNDSYQAHTYATHPEIAAEFYLLSNGREFKVYRAGNPDAPIFSWLKDETDEKLPTLRNLLGPDAMRKRAGVKIDIGKPLAEGLGSEARILNGHVVYERNTCSLPADLKMDGIRNGITGSRVFRADDGLISAVVEIVSAFAGLDDLNKRFGFSPFLFKTADEYISVNLFFIDPYLNSDFLARYLPDVSKSASVRLLGKKGTEGLLQAATLFATQYGLTVEVRRAPEIHDRYVLVDGSQGYHSGASFKDGGLHSPTSLMQVTDTFSAVRETYERIWVNSSSP